LIYHSSLLLSETLFTAILAWAMLLLIRPRGLFWGGWLLAMAAMVRPSAFLLPIILPLLAALLQHQEKNIGRIIVRTMAIGLVLLVLMGLWAWRNNCVLGRPIWTTTNQGITRLDGFNPQATGASNQAVFLTSEELAIASNLNEVQRDQRYAQMAGQWIDRTLREDPWQLVRLTFVKIARTWSPMPLSSDFGTPRHILAAMVWAVPFYLLVILGLLRRSLAGKIRLLLVVPAFYFTITVALSVGSLRYRIPVEPVLAVIAGSALWTKTQAPKMT
jgi:hypothetical protein